MMAKKIKIESCRDCPFFMALADNWCFGFENEKKLVHVGAKTPENYPLPDYEEKKS